MWKTCVARCDELVGVIVGLVQNGLAPVIRESGAKIARALRRRRVLFLAAA